MVREIAGVGWTELSHDKITAPRKLNTVEQRGGLLHTAEPGGRVLR